MSLDEDARDNSLVCLQRWLPTSHLVCGIESSDTAPSDLDSLPLFWNESGKLRTDLLPLHISDYMTGCHELQVRASADSQAGQDYMLDLTHARQKKKRRHGRARRFG